MQKFLRDKSAFSIPTSFVRKGSKECAIFKDKAELAKARAIIEKCGYWRRKEELEDAEGVIG
jgi:hypothetical protein